MPQRYDPVFGNIPRIPLSPYVLRNRHTGFGKATISHSTTTLPDGDRPNLSGDAFFVLHLSWDYLQPQDRKLLATASPIFIQYALLRARAFQIPVYHLRKSQPDGQLKTLNQNRAQLMAIALFRCNFIYGDLVRWLSGYYTNSQRDFHGTFDLIRRLCHQPPPPHYPPIDLDKAFRLCTMGAPLAGNFTSDRRSNRARILAATDRLTSSPDTIPAIEEKFIKEEKMCQHLLLPKWLWVFIPGLLITIITWVHPKPHRPADTGRLALDPSNPVEPTDIGTANSQIPDTGTESRLDENPECHYGTALQRYLTFLWNLRIDQPQQDILQFADDISGAFRRVLMHPDMATIFSTVFHNYLIMPVGCIFGAKNIPSYYMLLGELRAHIAATANLSGFKTTLSDQVQLENTPDHPDLIISRAAPDSQNQGILSIFKSPTITSPNASFVDDTGNAQTAQNIRNVINNSVLAAYIVFGFDTENAQPCLNKSKWNSIAMHVLKFLGYLIDSRAMTVEWPPDKRNQLRNLISRVFAFSPDQGPSGPGQSTPKNYATILGMTRNGCYCSKLGHAFTLRLQYVLTDAMRRKSNRHKGSSWWRYAKITCPVPVMRDLYLLWLTLAPSEQGRMWKQPIGLIIPRDPTITLLTDASFEGLGGYSTELGFMWRLTAPELKRLNINITSFSILETITTDRGDHDINILEFVAIVINLWLALKLLHHQHHQTGHRRGNLEVLHVLADNTSALGWLRYAARSKNNSVRSIATLLFSLLTFANVPFSLKKENITHIPGELNLAADALSRPISKGTSWASAIMNAGSTLQALQPYQLPSSLISKIFSCITKQNPGELSERKMIAIWKAKLATMPDGWQNATYPINISPN